MLKVKFRGRDVRTKEYIIGFLDIEKSWESKCLSCGSLNTEPYSDYDLQKCKCNNCGLDLSFDDDNWEHGYIGKERTLIRDNGEYFEVEEDSVAIHFGHMIDSDGKEMFFSLNKNGLGGDLLEGIGQYEAFFTSKITIFETFYSELNGLVFFNCKKECNLEKWLYFNKRYKNPNNFLDKIKVFGDLKVIGIKNNG